MLEIRDLHVQFHEADHEAVRGIDLTVGDGEIVGLVGESGSGKTVTAMMISGLLRPEQAAFRGQILLDGRDLLTSSGDTLRSIQGRDICVVHDTKAEHNHTNSPHQTENEIGQIVDYLNGVIGSKGGYGSTKHKGHCHNSHTVIAEAFLNLSSHRQLRGFLVLVLLKKFHRVNPPYKLNISSKSSSDRSS